MAFVNYNGRLLPADTPLVPAAHRGLRYGCSLFETMRWEDGRLPLGSLHWERLFGGMKAVLLECPGHWNAAFFEAEVSRLVRKCRLERRARVRLQVGPGAGGVFDRDGWQLEFIIECFPLQEAGLNENGLVVGIAESVTKDSGPLSHLKTGSALAYAVAAREALQARWNDALLRNSAGRVGESSIANVFWVREDGRVCTPPLSEGPVAGVCRAHLLAELPRQGIDTAEMLLTMDELNAAQAVFLTNAVRGIRWVQRCGGTVYAKGPVEPLVPAVFGRTD